MDRLARIENVARKMNIVTQMLKVEQSQAPIATRGAYVE